MIETNFIEIYEESYRKHWDYPALTNYTANTYYYKDLASRIALWHITFERLGIKRGDKVTLMGKDSAEWSIFFMATITYGAVIVPVLQDFAPNDAMGIIHHSDSRLLVINENIFADFDTKKIPLIENVIDLQSSKALYSKEGKESLSALLLLAQDDFNATYPNGFQKEDIKYYHTSNSEMLLLNYTSGTTGFSKGVMVTGNNLAGNVLFCRGKHVIEERDRMLCFLPMAHTYSCMTNLLLAMSLGVHVTILGKVPTPQILRKAFGDVKPQVIISVPLVLEKIYINTIMPIVKRKNMQILLKLPIIKGLLHKKISDKLNRGLGGSVRQVVIGGAALNPEVGAFLKTIGFPLTVGYGMTECAPLISYSYPTDWKLGSCGQVLEGYMQARIAPLDEAVEIGDNPTQSGEIQVRGENVCLGYYKNEEQTKALFTEDGWMKTGDLGIMDKDNVLYIKGRSKTMFLSGNGQNIYPEEIEAKISLLKYVQESVVVMRNGKLEALIFMNEQAINDAGVSRDEAWEAVKSQRAVLNESLGSYEKIQAFELMNEPFIKTPKQSIKRFLYK